MNVETWRDVNAALAGGVLVALLVLARTRHRTLSHAGLLFLLVVLGFLAALIVRAFVPALTGVVLASCCVLWALVAALVWWRE